MVANMFSLSLNQIMPTGGVVRTDAGKDGRRGTTACQTVTRTISTATRRKEGRCWKIFT